MIFNLKSSLFKDVLIDCYTKGEIGSGSCEI